jgi:hypothetical protein
MPKRVALTDKEVGIIQDLLAVAESGWYDDKMAKSKGFKSAKEYEDAVAKLTKKLD